MALSKQRGRYKHLSDEQYNVLVMRKTEPAGSGQLEPPPKGQEQVYVCVNCRRYLFSSHAKFASGTEYVLYLITGTGWPAFYEAHDNVHIKRDWRIYEGGQYVGLREEVVCKCGGHLGHLFRQENWDTPTDMRYCINASVLRPSS